jgi:hypothetical protein
MARSLKDGLVPDTPDPALAAMQTQAQPQLAPPGQQLVTVFLTNAVRTSAGPGPGPKQLPSDEANRLINSKMAVYGDQPPRNYLDGGQQGPAAGTVPFGSQVPVRSASSN